MTLEDDIKHSNRAFKSLLEEVANIRTIYKTISEAESKLKKIQERIFLLLKADFITPAIESFMIDSLQEWNSDDIEISDIENINPDWGKIASDLMAAQKATIDEFKEEIIERDEESGVAFSLGDKND